MIAGGRDGRPLPDGLRDKVLAAARQARAAGRPVPDAPEISPAEAYSRAADSFNGMLCALTGAQWKLTVLRGLDAQGLVGHLTGVEEDVHRCLAGDQRVADASHVDSTQAAADRQAGQIPEQTRLEWRRAADVTLGMVEVIGDLGAEAAMHGLRLPVGALLVVRAFELWTHENDIRRAAGLPPSVPDDSTLRLMTSLAVQLLPHAAARTGLDEPTSLHLVLTGPGGGTWDVGLGDAAGAVAVGIVVDAVEFCRLAAARVTPDALGPHVTGDAARAARVLAAVPVLALD
jgi:uncharacterized protein (TIGR03083 family)